MAGHHHPDDKGNEGKHTKRIAAGAPGYITRPLEMHRLLALLRTWLRR